MNTQSTQKGKIMKTRLKPSHTALALALFASGVLAATPADAQQGRPMAPAAASSIEGTMNDYRADPSRSRPIDLVTTPVNLSGVREDARMSTVQQNGDVKYIDILTERRGNKVTYVADMTGKYGPGNFIRMQGERGMHEYTFFLPEEVKPSSQTDTIYLQVAYANTIDVLPEKSAMEVKINGVLVDTLKLDAFHIKDHTIIGIELPRNYAALDYGADNTVSFKVTQNHRLDCTIEASYDMWTELDLSRTFLEFNLERPITGTSLADVDWLFGGTFAEDEPLRVYYVNETASRVIEAGAEVVQALALRSQDNNPSNPGKQRLVFADAHSLDKMNVDLNGLPQLDQMRNVIVGPRSAIRGKLSAFGDLVGMQGDGPMLAVAEVDGHNMGTLKDRHKAYVLIVTGDNEEQVSIAGRYLATQETLPEQMSQKVSADMIPTLDKQIDPNPAVVRGGETRTLAELGYETAPFGGLRDVTQVTLDLPPDFFVSDDTRIDLDVVAEWDPTVFGDPDEVAAFYEERYGPEAAALRQVNSRLNIFVNGQGVAQVDLAAEDVDAWTGNEPRNLSIPLRAFRPGRNVVEFEANIVRTPPSLRSDNTIDSGSSATQEHRAACSGTNRDDRPVFSLSDQTTIHIPEFPRLVQLPNLGMTATSGFPYYYNREDATRSQSSELERLAGAGYAQNRAPDFNLYVPGVDRNGDAAGARLSAAWTLVGRLAQAAGGPMRARGISNPQAEAGSTLVVADLEALRNDDVMNNAPFAASDLSSNLSNANFDVYDPEARRGEQESIVRTERVVAAQDSQIPTEARSPNFLQRRLQQAEEFFATDEVPNTELTISDKSETNSMMVMQYESNSDFSTVTTVTARTPELLALGVETLVAEPWWRRLNGEATSISTLGPEHTANQVTGSNNPRNYYELPQEFQMGNVQRLFSNWFSRNYREWLFFTVILLAVTAIVTWGFVRMTGQTDDPQADRG
ncbi:MAG: cellulose biosynthesis cyclic di-GMP-binding regulatory protein BcsB [Alphaproteobacteria bacterium]